MRAIHALAPVGRWELLDDGTQRLAIANGRKVLERLAKRDAWWELGVGVSLIKWKPPGFRKPQVCMVMHGRELVELDHAVRLTDAERSRLYRRGKTRPVVEGAEDHDDVVEELRGW